MPSPESGCSANSRCFLTGTENPFSLRTKVNVAIESGALVLVSGRVEVLRASLELLSATARLYPVTGALDATISSVSVTTPEGSFLRTGIREAGTSESNRLQSTASRGKVQQIRGADSDLKAMRSWLLLYLVIYPLKRYE